MVKKINITKLEKDDKLSDIFHENTKFFFPDTSDIKLESYPESWKKIHFKVYPRFKRVFLPTKFNDNSKSLESVIRSRSSDRDFQGKFLKLEDLSRLLLYSAGIIRKSSKWDETRRAYPSAGARYPLEVYVVVFKVKSLASGIYHYNIKEHSLELIIKGSFKRKMIKYTNYQKWIKNSSIVILISAIFKRNKIKYRDRGYRYVLLEAGHMGQNFYLVSNSIGLRCCSIGGFLDEEINKLIDLDGINESIIYILAIGE